MKLLTTIAAGLVLALGWVTSRQVEARAQLEDEGLAIYGTVMVPGTRDPVPGARVLLGGGGNTFTALAEGTPVGEPVFVTADANGRFRFSGLPAGPYRLNALAPDDPEGRARTLDTTFLDLRESGPPPDVRVWLQPTSEISGRITDANGDPVAGISVGVGVLGRLLGQPTLGPSFDNLASVPTDDNGRYALSVIPGEYYLFVGSAAGTETVPRYYPGVLFPEDALRVTVQPGIDVPGMNIVLEDVARVRLRFQFRAPATIPGIPEPVSAYLSEESVPLSVQVRPLGRGLIASPAYMAGIETLGDDWYRTDPLAPGNYQVRLGFPPELQTALFEALGPAGIRTPIPDPLARFALTLDGREPGGEVDLGSIPALTSGAISGRVILADRSDFDARMFPVVLLSEGLLGASRHRATVGEDGQFVFEFVAPGIYAIGYNAQNLPDGWYVRSVRSGAQDVARDGLELAGPAATPIEIVLAGDGGRIEGVVRSPDDALAPGARVLLLPAVDRRGPFDQLTGVESNESGAFVLDSVAPGEYRLLAIDEAGLRTPPGFYGSPEFYRDYEAFGERITVDPGTNVTANLETIPYVP